MLKILFALAVLAECVTVPLFLKHYWPQKCKASLTYKMISATLFVVVGVLAMVISGNTGTYAVLILVGLVLGWFGDLFLHSLSDSKLHFVIGFLSFMAGHVVYIVALHKAIKSVSPTAGAYSLYELLAILGSVMALLLIFIIRKIIKEKVLYVAFTVYGFILFSMLVKSIKYYVLETMAANSDANLTGILLTMVLGAVLFTISDVLLGFIIAKGETKRMGRIINIGTYFVAQLLIGSSIFFIAA